MPQIVKSGIFTAGTSVDTFEEAKLQIKVTSFIKPLKFLNVYQKQESGLEEKIEKSIRNIPTVKFYMDRYAQSLQGNDEKGAKVFKEFESAERVRRLRDELLWIKDEKVNEKVLHNLVGKKRLSQKGSYKRWAELMLLWLARKY